MTSLTKNDSKAPVYRYYTVDLLSNQILAEIPFGEVSYERAIKGAGAFSGQIPVLPLEEHRSWNLYESTMPGKTGLFIMRNGVCVWGGIIWTRKYNVVNRVLNVSASEFTSYFYHRRIWKTWSHQFGAKVIVSGGKADVYLDWDAAATINAGSSVKFEFYDPKDFRYNGHYIVARDPAPTQTRFQIEGAVSTVGIVSIERKNNVVTIQTDKQHHYATGDQITLDIDGTLSYMNGTYPVTSIGGDTTDRFTITRTGPNVALTETTGTATRPLPAGTYESVTVSVRADTFDYIRSLVEGVFNDFSGVAFPNVEIEPGITYRMAVINRELQAGTARITTSEPHEIALGQAVNVVNVGPGFDGEVTVTAIPEDNVFEYEASGNVPASSIAVTSATIVARSLLNSEATITTQANHGFKVGQKVSIVAGLGADGNDEVFNGIHKIKAIPTPKTFRYEVSSQISVPETALTQPTATVAGNTRSVTRRVLEDNVVTLTTATPHGYGVGNQVTVANVDHIVPILEKTLNIVGGEATITTSGPHGLGAGDQVKISGLSDVFALTKKEITGSAATKRVSFTTKTPHNFQVGKSITLKDVDDIYSPKTYNITNGVATVSTGTNHNIDVGTEVTIANTEHIIPVLTAEVSSNTAVITHAANVANLVVGDRVDITQGKDLYSKEVNRVQIKKGVATLTFVRNHNIKVGDKIVVSAIGSPYNGAFTVQSTTKNTITYRIEKLPKNVQADKYNVAAKKVAGSVTTDKTFLMGTHTVEGVSTTGFTFSFKANNFPKRAFAGGSGTAQLPTRINGVRAVTAVTATTVSFPLSANNQASTTVRAPNEPNAPAPVLSIPSIHEGTHIVKVATRTTFGFDQAVTRTVPMGTTNGVATTESIFNGTETVTAVPTPDTFRIAMSGINNVHETSIHTKSYVSAPNVFNGTYTISAVNAAANTFSFTKNHPDVAAALTTGYGYASVSPYVTVGSYGPFPGNANIGIRFSTQEYSGVNIDPVPYRSFQLTNVGEALDSYSDTIDGFEYRIDCDYDPDTKQFIKTFVLIPIDFPDPPKPGDVSPISRFGADRLVFEYPGNIDNLEIAESAENAATRFFVLGDSDLGEEAGDPFSVATAGDMLNGKEARRWPLLDEDEQVQDIYDETVLYAYAKRYLSESRPPDATLTVSVNGSLQPVVGSYAPGDWCSILVEDEFIRQRLQSDLEPRDTVIVRKIDAIKVQVPDGTTFPEKVSLTLVPEWEVDKK